MNKSTPLRIGAFLCALAIASLSSAQTPKTIPVKFSAGKTSATIKGNLKGRQDLDYVVSAGAGQTLAVSMKATNGAAYFNILPPGSESAMVNGEFVDNKASRIAPIEGKYRIRVYLMRSAGRRDESASFTLNIGVTGKALPALKGGSDALVKGTPYHATAKAPVENYIYKDLKTCDAGVIRRSHDGTATVVFSFKGQKRTFLFEKGKLVAWDSTDQATCAKEGDEFVISVGKEEVYRIPEAFLMGG